MYAIAFDLVVANAERHHPKGVSQAYADIGSILNEHGFRRVQGSLYVTERRHGESVPGDASAACPGMVSVTGARHPRVPH